MLKELGSADSKSLSFLLTLNKIPWSFDYYYPSNFKILASDDLKIINSIIRYSERRSWHPLKVEYTQ